MFWKYPPIALALLTFSIEVCGQTYSGTYNFDPGATLSHITSVTINGVTRNSGHGYPAGVNTGQGAEQTWTAGTRYDNTGTYSITGSETVFTTVMQSTSFTVSITGSGVAGNSFAVWFDADGDGDLEASEGQVYYNLGCCEPTKSFTVTSGTTEGHLLLRVAYLNRSGGGDTEYATGDATVHKTTHGGGEVEDYIIDVNTAAVLPVEWLNVEAVNGFVNWSTATETNNDHFEIQQSTDGKNFETIDTRPGAGTTTQPSDYQWKINEPGTVYYRIAQVDYDGTRSYSKVVVPSKRAGFSPPYPNPAADRFHIDGAEGEVMLLDLTGKVIRRWNSGDVYSVEGIAPGIYQVQTVNNSHASKLVVR